MKIVDTPLGEIRPYGRNAKKHDAKQVANVAESIRQYGFVQPIVVDGDGVIVIGHCRYAAAKKLGMAAVPVVRVDELTPEQVDALRIVDNKTNESPWDIELLAEDLPRLDLDAFDFDFALPMIEDEVGEVEEDGCEPMGAADEIPPAVEDEPPEVDETNEPTCRRGDVWQLGRHKLMCGDSTNPQDIQTLMGGEKADLLLTDPPYNVNYGSVRDVSEAVKRHRRTDGLMIENDNMDDESFLAFLTDAFRAADESIKPGAVYYIWHADNQSLNFRSACRSVGWQIRECLVWNKNALCLGRQDYQWKHEPCLYGWKDGAAHYWGSDRRQTTVLDFDKPSRSDIHPTMKPVRLFDYQIRNSCREGGMVLDIFGGSGTTLVACEQNGRVCRTMEIDPRYCDAIIKRWETLTGEKAIKI